MKYDKIKWSSRAFLIVCMFYDDDGDDGEMRYVCVCVRVCVCVCAYVVCILRLLLQRYEFEI